MAGQIQQIRDEISSPTYDGMNNIDIANSLNAKTRDRNRASMPGTEILEACDEGELLALTGDAAIRVWGVINLPEINPFGLAEKIFIDAFPDNSITLTNLQIARVEQISWAEEVGYPGHVREGHVEMAKA